MKREQWSGAAVSKSTSFFLGVVLLLLLLFPCGHFHFLLKQVKWIHCGFYVLHSLINFVML